MMRERLVVTLVMVWQCAAMNAAEVTLVQQRRAVAVIALAADAPWIERHAANELSQFVMRITGALLPMVLIYWVVITGHASRRGCGTCSSNW